jgi:hypothetical protein
MVDLEKSFRIANTGLASFEMQPYEGKDFNKALDFDIELALKINPEKSFISYKIQVRIREKDTEKVFAYIVVDTIYELYKFDAVVKYLEASEFTLDLEINKILSRIALGVTRGFLSAQIQKTYLSHVVLPLLPIEL